MFRSDLLGRLVFAQPLERGLPHHARAGPREFELVRELGLKTGVTEAIEKELLQRAKVKIPTTNKAGKTKNKSVDVVQLTEAGEKYLRDAAKPDDLPMWRETSRP